jgi:hypothetical protein
MYSYIKNKKIKKKRIKIVKYGNKYLWWAYFLMYALGYA